MAVLLAQTNTAAAVNNHSSSDGRSSMRIHVQASGFCVMLLSSLPLHLDWGGGGLLATNKKGCTDVFRRGAGISCARLDREKGGRFCLCRRRGLLLCSFARQHLNLL